jgi:hypothetical protein
VLRLESYLHRETLVDIIRRWMVNEPRPADVLQLKTIINLNSYVARIWLDRIARRVLGHLYGTRPVRVPLRNKGQLKDFVVDHPTYANARIEEMVARYRRFPEDFYRSSPIDGWMYTLGDRDAAHIVGTCRIKLFHRIAEKGARRIVDFVLQRIRRSADVLAEQRAKALGVPHAELQTSREVMQEEFAHAERRVIKSIKNGAIAPDLPPMRIPDVAGIKIIQEEDDFPTLLEAIHAGAGCRVVESERHTGNYNAINLRVEHEVPKDWLRTMPPRGPYRDIMLYRGMDPDELDAAYEAFLDRAESTVGLEIIASTFEEYLESEVGRSMHEERVLEQRTYREYNSHLAVNVRYLMSWIFQLCRGPGMPEVDDIPVKLWVKYMPEAYDRLARAVFVADDAFFYAVDELPSASQPG